jgi:3-phenylpropionate/cinnamic acid dioxygenase small subunit
MSAHAAATRSQGQRVPSGSEGYWRCVEFLVDEAEALDENRLDDWLAMLHPELEYVVPIRLTRERSAEGRDISDEGLHLFENHETLTLRVERFTTDFAWSEDPPSRTRRFLTNFRVSALPDGDFHVRQNFLLYRERMSERGSQTLSGERDDVLRELDGELKLVRRSVLLDHAVLTTPNLGIFL